jgi:HD-like signal output (HDOD) protein
MLRTFRHWVESQPDAEPVIEMKLNRAVYKLDQLPTLSETTVRALALANDEHASLKQFADLIRKDGAVATSLLKIANSIMYQASRQIVSIDQAVVRIGMKGCKNLIASIGMRSIFQSVPKEIQTRCELLWQHSFFTASLAAYLNLEMKLGLDGEEFTAGLLHDLGRMVIAVAVHSHHAPYDEPDYRNLVAVVSLADHIANHVQRESKISNYDPRASDGYRVLTARWDLGRCLEFTQSLRHLTVRAIKDTRTLIRSQA